MNAVTKWISGWKRNGWMAASKKLVAIGNLRCESIPCSMAARLNSGTSPHTG
ncbi:hypothetical protein [Streptomyces kronopolitis]|uniref:hypothetical protein n=1 Tax=Streptomyces kronopolitis TaxID=1612435 RepID=UPI003D95C705